jgi:hypothetical protein
MQDDEVEATDDHFVMVGTVQCNLQSEVYVHGQNVVNLMQRNVSPEPKKTDADSEAKPKRARILTIQGRKVVPRVFNSGGQEKVRVSRNTIWQYADLGPSSFMR